MKIFRAFLPVYFLLCSLAFPQAYSLTGTDLTVPGPIGGTTPSTGAFTSLSATTSLTLGTSGSLFGGTNLIEQRNGTNAQIFRLYGTYTDASNYERLEVITSAGNTLIQQNQGGTGAGRGLSMGTVGNATLRFYTNNLTKWLIDGSGHLTANADNAYDIGASGATRPRNLYLGGTLVGGVQPLSGAGAVNLTTLSTKLTTSGIAQALTLANGVEGQIKTITYIAEGGGTDSAILTPTTATGFVTVTFTTVGNSVTLQYFTTVGWMIISNYGCTIA